MRVRLALVTAVVLGVVTSVAGTGAASAAPPPGACHDPAPASPVENDLPWAQKTLNAAEVREHGTGKGVTVAIVDSGVDGDHPQLRQRGKVLRGEDFFLTRTLPGRFDCVSHGTAVAGIVAAEPAGGIGFAGLAPDATILPVRVSDSDEEDANSSVDPEVLARGIWYAVEQGADVINLSIAGTLDNYYVREAIRHAVNNDRLVVAAVGNAQQGAASGPITFPAGYDGVLGVGAADMQGNRLENSQIGPQVDIVAPGKDVLSVARVGGHQYRTGTSFAAPFVSATAALVRSKWPELSAREVAERIVATATPPPGRADAYGAGLVNPYRALTERLVEAPPVDPPAVERPVQDLAEQKLAAWWTDSTTDARTLTLLTGSGVLLALAAVVVLVRGRRGRWQPRLAELPPREPVREDLPEEMFVVPPPPAER